MKMGNENEKVAESKYNAGQSLMEVITSKIDSALYHRENNNLTKSFEKLRSIRPLII